MKSFYRSVLGAVICFLLIVHGYGGFCHTPHGNAGTSSASHKSHTTSVHKIESPEECCRTSSKDPFDWKATIVLPDKTKKVQGLPDAFCPTPITTVCFQFSDKNFISKLSNTINPVLVSLRTVILLA